MKITEKTLPNGLRIVLAPQSDAATATVLVLVGTGSKYETKKENGLSHFLEHMYFKGTEKHPTAQSIAEAFDNLGAISNAFTGHEYTGYYAKGNPAHVDTFVEVLSDIYLHSTFPEAEIEKEKGVIVEEINMYEDNPQHKVWDTLFETVYGDQPVGWPISGSKENVMGFTRADFIKYQQSHYTAGNTVIVVAGAFDQKAVVKKVTAAFTGIHTAPARKRKKVIDTQKEAHVAVRHKATDQAHIVLGFRSVPLEHKDATAISLLGTILGGGMSSRLFLKLREEMGAAYYVRADQDGFIDHGLFAISAGIDKKRLPEIINGITEVLRDLKTHRVSEQELRKVKEYTLGMMRLGLESSDSIAGFYGSQVLLKGTYKTPEQLTKEYLAITAADIQRVAKKILIEKNSNLCVVGPFQQEDVSATLLKNLSL